MSSDVPVADSHAHENPQPPRGPLTRFVVGLIHAGGTGIVIAIAAIVLGFAYSLYEVTTAQRNRELAAASAEDSDDDVLHPPIYDLALDSSSGELFHRDYRGAVSRLTPAALGNEPLAAQLFEGRRCDQMRMSPVRIELALAFRNGDLLLHDPTGIRSDRVLSSDTRGIVNYLSYSPDGTLLASGSSDGSILLHELSSDLPLSQSLEHPDTQIVSMAFSGTDVLYVSTDRDIHEWKLVNQLSAAPQYVRLIANLHRARELQVTPDRRFLICGGLNGVLQCWNLIEDRMQWELPALSPTCRGLAVSPDGRLVSASRSYNLLELFDIETGAVSATLKTTMQFVNSSVFSDDGAVLFSACTNGTIHFWSIADQIQLGSLAPDTLRR